MTNTEKACKAVGQKGYLRLLEPFRELQEMVLKKYGNEPYGTCTADEVMWIDFCLKCSFYELGYQEGIREGRAKAKTVKKV